MFFHNPITYEQWKYAFVSVASRGFSIEIDGKVGTVLVTMADLFNHDPQLDYNSTWSFNQEKKQFEIKSLADVPAGEQVFINYGTKSNGELLLNYGFVLDNNKDDVIVVSVALDDDSPYFDIRNEMLHKLNASELAFGKDQISGELLAAWRVLMIEDSVILEDEKMRQKILNKESVGLDYDYLTMLGANVFCEMLLQGYPTSLPEDVELLEEGGLTDNARNALILTSNEKIIIFSIIQQLNEVIELLRPRISKKLESQLYPNAKQMRDEL